MNAPSRTSRSRFWRKHYAVPADHGSWTWWIGPVVVGVAAGGHPHGNVLSLVLAALAAFLMHQPLTIAVKAFAGRRPRTDLKPALGWTAIYAFLALLGVACLVASGNAKILALAAPGLVVFTWYLALVARKSERRQLGVQVLAAGTLALGAPAAYWVAGGTDYPEPWVLWLLLWLQSASAIVNVYLRLEQRRWPTVPPLPERLRAGRRTITVHFAALVTAWALVLLRQVPLLAATAYALTFLDALEATWNPRLGARPAQVGIRQLLVWALFVAILVAAYRL